MRPNWPHTLPYKLYVTGTIPSITHEMQRNTHPPIHMTRNMPNHTPIGHATWWPIHHPTRYDTSKHSSPPIGHEYWWPIHPSIEHESRLPIYPPKWHKTTPSQDTTPPSHRILHLIPHLPSYVAWSLVAHPPSHNILHLIAPSRSHWTRYLVTHSPSYETFTVCMLEKGFYHN